MKEESMRMSKNSKLEQETVAVVSEISSKEVQRENPIAGIYRETAGVALQVYKRRSKMTKVAPVVVELELDERIQRMESLVGKYDNASLIDIYFMDSYQFLAM